MTTSKFDFAALANEAGMTVTFVKKNGEKRVMKCTTNMDAVMKCGGKVPTGPSRAKAGLHVVFDLDKKSWRSFLDATVTQAVANK